jgi:anti-sigma-K factor RskA
MSDIHALSGAYALDALDDVERAQFDRHLATCAECRAEVRSFCETAALMAEVEAETAPESLRAGVLSGIGAVRPLPPEASVTTTGPSHAAPVSMPVRRRALPTLLAAAVALILLATGAFAWHPWTSDRTTLAEQIINAPDAVRVTEHLAGGAGDLTLVRSESLGRAVMIGDHVPEPKPGKVYQLWLQQPGQGWVSAGLMPDSTQPTVLSGNVVNAKVAAITVEPDPGSSQPTSVPIAVFKLRAST